MIKEGKQRLGGSKPITSTPRPKVKPLPRSPFTAYSDRADDFVNSTRDLDMSELYEEFLPYVVENGTILDIGVGSGRDSKEFIQRGYSVVMLEPDSELAKHAAQYVGQYVIQDTIQGFSFDHTFDGIWASASLLHLHPAELTQVFYKLADLLNPGGVLYVSFKYGARDVKERNGLHYTYLNERDFDEHLPRSFFRYQKIWVTADRRPDRKNEKWLNVVVRRTAQETDFESFHLLVGHLDAQHRAAKENDRLRTENAQLKEQLATVRGRVLDVCIREWQQASTSEGGEAIKRCIRALENLEL